MFDCEYFADESLKTVVTLNEEGRRLLGGHSHLLDHSVVTLVLDDNQQSIGHIWVSLKL